MAIVSRGYLASLTARKLIEDIQKNSEEWKNLLYNHNNPKDKEELRKAFKNAEIGSNLRRDLDILWKEGKMKEYEAKEAEFKAFYKNR